MGDENVTNPIKRVSGLGRGLSALLDDAGPDPRRMSINSDEVMLTQRLPVAQLHPNATQPRRRFNADAMTELVESIRARGVLQPILVRPRVAGGFEIIAGERRWRAAQTAQRHDVPVTVINADDALAFEIALIENVQREDLNPVEEADGYRRLMDEFGHTQEGLAKTVGKSRSHIANILRLTTLSGIMREHLIEGRLSFGHAKALMAHDNCEFLAEQVIKDSLSVRQTEALVAGTALPKPGGSPPSPANRKTPLRDPDIQSLEQMLSDAIGLTVQIDSIGAAGTVRIAYTSLAQLDALIERLSGPPKPVTNPVPVLNMSKGAPSLRLDVPTFFQTLPQRKPPA